MAWSLVNVGSPTKINGSGEGDTTPALNLPTYSAGNILFAVGAMRDYGGTYGINSTPSGYVEIESRTVNAKKVLSICAKVAGASESAPEFGADSGSTFMGLMFSFSGGPSSIASASDIVDVSGDTSGTASHPYTVSALNPTVDNCLILYVATLSDDVWTTGQALPNSTTAILSDNSASNYDGTFADMALIASYAIQTTKSNLSSSSFTDNDSNTPNWATVALALKPGVTTVKYLKLLTHPSAASATGVEGWVVDADNTTYYGRFTGAAFEASLEDGEAVLKVAVTEFGGEALITSDTPQVVTRNTTTGTTMCDATVIEE